MNVTAYDIGQPFTFASRSGRVDSRSAGSGRRGSQKEVEWRGRSADRQRSEGGRKVSEDQTED